MASIVKTRARALAKALREKAMDIVEERLTPSTGSAIVNGNPHCAFGHAITAAIQGADAKGLDLGYWKYNPGLFKMFLNGEYATEVAESVRMRLETMTNYISDANDNAFLCQPTPEGRRETAERMRDLAVSLEDIAQE